MKLLKTFLYLFILTLALCSLIGCAGGSGPTTIPEEPVVSDATRIAQSFNGWVKALNERDYEAIQTFYAPDYLLAGTTRDEELNMLAFIFFFSDLVRIRVEDVSYSNFVITGNIAQVTIGLTWITSQSEPNGSWVDDQPDVDSMQMQFRRSGDTWLLLGDQQELPEGAARATSPPGHLLEQTAERIRRL